MIEVEKNSIIYVLCPAYTKTGGTELLHQLVHSLNKNSINAKITYYNLKDDNNSYTSDDFKKYIDSYELANNINDDEKNLIVIPEISVEWVNKYKRIRKAVWWLSVDNYLINHKFSKIKEASGLKNAIKKTFKNIISHNKKDIYKANYHLCQSYYAIDFLNKKGIYNVFYLSDYINDSYLNSKFKIEDKKDIVLYNPKKGYEFTKKIIEKAQNLKWVPIENMTTEQVKNLLLESKVYIDFGNHPGKDRFPRESAICGCCVITGKRGAAAFEKDVPLLDEYKFSDDEKYIPDIIKKINSCIKNYKTEIKKFNNYRMFISSEKEKFEKDIKSIFVVVD